MSAMVMSTLSEAAEQMMKSLTPSERAVLELRFKDPRPSFSFLASVHLRSILRDPVSFRYRVKRGRGQRKNRRDRAGRVLHEAHRWVALLLKPRAPTPMGAASALIFRSSLTKVVR